MRSTIAIAALAAVAYAAPAPQAVTQPVGPKSTAPAGCATTYNGKFQIAAVNVTTASKRSVIEERQSTCDTPGSLTLTLAGGTLTDALGRTGCIVANYQFQFDGPPQAGTIYNTGFSTCANSTLALGGSTIFYQCLSGTFYNLYDRSIGAHCNAVYLQVLPCAGGGAGGAPGGVGQGGDGQPTNTGVGAPVTQISDGQVQASTGKPAVTQIGDGQIQAPTGRPISQIGDGQIQAPTGKPTATSKAAPITQIGDGQIQAPTGRPISQISDGQIQAPTDKPTATSTAAPITQISDGQIQAPTNAATTAKAPVVTQISDGQIQAPTNASSTIVPFTGSASTAVINSAVLVVAGLVSFMML